MTDKLDRLKEKIRDRSESSGGGKYLYRGNEIDKLVDEVVSGEVVGGEHDIYTGEMLAPPQDPVGTPVEDLPWDRFEDEMTVETVPITGGFSDSLAQTHRFNGAMNTSIVLRADNLPLKKVEYSYDFYNDNPGVYSHVRSSVDGEIRETQYLGSHPLGKLTGFVKQKIRSGGERRVEVDGYSVSGDLPGTSSNSLIAQESEWVAESGRVSISRLVDGFVTVIEPLSARVTYSENKDMVPGDAPPAEEILEEAFERYTEPIPAAFDHYLLLVDDFQDYENTDYGGWRVSDIREGVLNGQRIPAEDIPQRYRGVEL